MSRSVWKGPFVDPSLLKKVESLKGKSNPAPIKTLFICISIYYVPMPLL